MTNREKIDELRDEYFNWFKKYLNEDYRSEGYKDIEDNFFVAQSNLNKMLQLMRADAEGNRLILDDEYKPI